MTTPESFRAFWPITRDDLDEPIDITDLTQQALHQLPEVLSRAQVRLVPSVPPSWWVAWSVDVPGSGRVTERVLMCEVKVVRVPPRAYRRRSAGVAR